MPSGYSGDTPATRRAQPRDSGCRNRAAWAAALRWNRLRKPPRPCDDNRKGSPRRKESRARRIATICRMLLIRRRVQQADIGHGPKRRLEQLFTVTMGVSTSYERAQTPSALA